MQVSAGPFPEFDTHHGQVVELLRVAHKVFHSAVHRLQDLLGRLVRGPLGYTGRKMAETQFLKVLSACRNFRREKGRSLSA